MEDIEIINLWKSYDKKLEENLLFNKKNAEEITKLKVKSFLSSMKPMKIFIVLASLIWVGFVDTLIINLYHIASPFFLISALIHVLLNKLAIAIYLYQLILIHQVDINEPIIKTQEKLGRLQSATLWITRLLFLQLPVWTTFYWNESMLELGNFWLYSIQFLVTASFTYLAFWLFFNIKYENRDKKWFRLIFNGTEWNPIIKSMQLLSQIDEYKNDPK
jgi:hypothetical protein